MEDFGAKEIVRFLTAVDANLAAPARMVIIGGGAAALAFGIASTTEDLDTENTLSKALLRAVAAAQTETGLDLSLEEVLSAGDAPARSGSTTARRSVA